MEKLTLNNCGPEDVIGLLQHSTDSSPDLYGVLQKLSPTDLVVTELGDWNEICLGEDEGYLLETRELVIKSADKELPIYVLEVGELRQGNWDTTRYVYETLQEVEQTFEAQVERLKRVFPNFDSEDLEL